MGAYVRRTRSLVSSSGEEISKKFFEKIYMNWLQRVGTRSPRTAQIYRQACNLVTPYIAELAPTAPLARLSPGDAAAVLHRLAGYYSPATVRLAQSALSSLYNHAKEEGAPVENVWRQVPPRRSPVRVSERILTEAQVAALFAAAPNPRTALFFRFLYYTGARVSGAVRVRGRDFRVTDDGCVVALTEKGEKTRWVALPPLLWAEIVAQGLPADDERIFPWSRQAGWRKVKRAARLIGVPKASPHWLRHSAATHALAHSASLPEVSRWLGHARIETTMIYTHATGAEAPTRLPWL
jgi:integrase